MARFKTQEEKEAESRLKEERKFQRKLKQFSKEIKTKDLVSTDFQNEEFIFKYKNGQIFKCSGPIPKNMPIVISQKGLLF